MLRSHYMKFSCYTSIPDPCHSTILIYVTIDGFSYAQCNENRFDPLLIYLIDRIVIDAFGDDSIFARIKILA